MTDVAKVPVALSEQDREAIELFERAGMKQMVAHEIAVRSDPTRLVMKQFQPFDRRDFPFLDNVNGVRLDNFISTDLNTDDAQTVLWLNKVAVSKDCFDEVLIYSYYDQSRGMEYYAVGVRTDVLGTKQYFRIDELGVTEAIIMARCAEIHSEIEQKRLDKEIAANYAVQRRKYYDRFEDLPETGWFIWLLLIVSIGSGVGLSLLLGSWWNLMWGILVLAGLITSTWIALHYAAHQYYQFNHIDRSGYTGRKLTRDERQKAKQLCKKR